MVILIDRKKEPRLCFLCKKNYDKENYRPECLIPCGHTFCKTCINKFDMKKKSCPLCKMYYNQVIPDYEMMDMISTKQQEPTLEEKLTRPITARTKNLSKLNLTVSKNEIKEEKTVEDSAQKKDTNLEKETSENKLKPEICHLIMEGTKSQQLIGVVEVRKFLSKEKFVSIDEVIEAGLVPKLTEFLKSNDMTLVFESAWALTNVASGNSNQAKAVVNAGAVPLLVELMNSTEENIQEQSIWALGNIAGDGAELRDYTLNHGILNSLLKVLTSKTKSVSLIKNSVWCLSNLCRGKPNVDFEKVKPALPVLQNLLEEYENEQEVIIDVLWSLCYLSDGPDERIQLFVDNFNLEPIIKKLNNPNTKIITPAIRAIGNIASGSDEQTQVILDLNVLDYLSELLTNEKNTILKETCWTLSNITAGTQLQIQQVIDKNIFPKILPLCKFSNINISKEAMWTVANAFVGGSNEQVKYLNELDTINIISDLIKTCEEKTILKLCLSIFESMKNKIESDFGKILEENEVVDLLINLECSENLEISELASKILVNLDLDDYIASNDEKNLSSDDDKDVIT